MRTVDDLLSVAVYARDRVNPYLFNYALSVALLHRPDTQNLDLPSFIHSFPDKFVDAKVFNAARETATVIPQSSRVSHLKTLVCWLVVIPNGQCVYNSVFIHNEFFSDYTIFRSLFRNQLKSTRTLQPPTWKKSIVWLTSGKTWASTCTIGIGIWSTPSKPPGKSSIRTGEGNCSTTCTSKS